MAEQLFLCGLTAAQRAAFKGGRELHLHGPQANLRLKLDDIRRRLLDMEDPLLADLVEIATYVFAVDNLVSRGGLTFTNMGESWRRKYRIVVAVRRPGTWKEPQLLHSLCDALGFLSEDIDSFAGAVQELNTSNRHIVLLSRRIGPITDGRQRELADELSQRYRRRITHVRVSAGLTDETKAIEHTQRTRTFLLSAIALVAAAIERTDRICFYENGVMSVNLPISPQVVGARASRSTPSAFAPALGTALQPRIAEHHCHREPVYLED